MAILLQSRFFRHTPYSASFATHADDPAFLQAERLKQLSLFSPPDRVIRLLCRSDRIQALPGRS